MQTQTIEYQHQDKTFAGLMAYDEAHTEKRPGIMICHAWAGRDEFVENKAKALAAMGYIGFAADVYGKGVLGSGPEENMNLMKPLMEDRKLLQDRLLTGLKTLQQQKQVDESRIAAIGFCFGGLCVLDLARAGAEIKGVVSFHGLLGAPEGLPNRCKNTKVLVLHGYDDPMVSPEQALAFADEMTQANVDWQLHAYGLTKHAFTNPDANNETLGTIYNPVAELRALQSMEYFLKEIFSS